VCCCWRVSEAIKRLLKYLIIQLLLVGLLGPMTAYAWSVALRRGVLEEEHDTHKEMAVFRSEPRLTEGRGTVPLHRPSRSGRAPHSAARVLPPAQTQLPRVTVVWQPSRMGADDDPLCA
jgi:hypothetical protein